MENFIAFLESYGNLIAWIVIGLLTVGLGLLAILNNKKGRFDARLIAFAALSIALAMILNFISSILPLPKMPQGGSITIARLLPLIIFAYIYGFTPGCIVGAIYGILDFIMSPWFFAPMQFMLDYPIAFACVGFAGIQFFKGKKGILWSLILGTIITGLARFTFSTVSGILYLGATPAFSLAYNSIILIDTAICLVVALPMFASKSLVHLIEGQKPSYRTKLI